MPQTKKMSKGSALVTGGAVRLGKVFTLSLAEAGYNLAIHYNASSDEATATAAEVRKSGVECEAFQFDFSQVDDVSDLIKEVKVSNAVLETYIGKYELQPGFILTVTREGNQLKTQATGQPVFDIFPKAENEFYLKVVDAQLVFNKNDAGAS